MKIWVVMIANLFVKLVKAQVNRMWSFSNLVSLLRHSLGYYYDLFLPKSARIQRIVFILELLPDSNNFITVRKSMN